MNCLKPLCYICMSPGQEKPLSSLAALDVQQLSCYNALIQTKKDSYSEKECSCRSICMECSCTLQTVTQFRIMCIRNREVLSEYHPAICANKNQPSQLKDKIIIGPEVTIPLLSDNTAKEQTSSRKTDKVHTDMKEEQINEEIYIKTEESTCNDSQEEESIINIVKKQKTVQDALCANIKVENEEDETHTMENIDDSPRECIENIKEEPTHFNIENNDGVCQNPMYAGSSYKCTHCQINFASTDFFYQHLDLCQKQSKHFSENMLQDMTRQSSANGDQNSKEAIISEKDYSCSECGKRWINKSLLERHMRIHTGEKPFVCEECGKSFNRKTNLLTHTRTHSGEKPFQCEVCDKSFYHKNYLLAHARIHTGEKPYSCKLCGKAFKWKNVLVTHLRTHTGEKPYVCKLCGKSFKARSHLATHKRAHAAKFFQCEVCDTIFNHKRSLTTHVRKNVCRKPVKLEQNLEKT